MTEPTPAPDRDEQVRAAQIQALAAIRALYDDLGLPPLYWTIEPTGRDSLVERIGGQIHRGLGDEDYRRQTLAAYAAHIGATPRESGRMLTASGHYCGVSVFLYTPIAAREQEVDR